jgi:AraC family transcriptional regulator
VKLTTREDYLERIRRVLWFVQEHLDDPLPPGRLAGIANLSVHHFHRIFSGLVGESMGDHVRRLRLERAAGELRRTDRAVVDIALEAGYEAHEPFTRAFRAWFGEPPSAYRKAAEPRVFPPALCGVHYGTAESVSRFVPLQEGSHMIDVRIESFGPRTLLALPHRGDYNAIGGSFERLLEMAASHGLLTGAPVTLGIYHDDPDVVPVADLRSHACLVIDRAQATLPEGCETLDLPAGEFAVGVHKGPYHRLGESYRWLFGQWLPSSGREPADLPCHELYVSDARTTPEDDLVTHICVPLAHDATEVAALRGR